MQNTQARAFSRCTGIRVVVEATGHRHRHATPSETKPSEAKPSEAKPSHKHGNGAPGGAKVWPRHADGCCHPLALRARRAPQNVPLRESSASGALRAGYACCHHPRKRMIQ
jgi:hypothetical protein